MSKHNVKRLLSLVLICTLFISNIGVLNTKAENVTQTDVKQLSFNDYETANTNLVYEGGRSETFANLSGDLSPLKTDDNTHGNVLWYQQAWYGLGIVYLGYDYQDGTLSNQIEVEPGVTYQVEYEYKAFGTATYTLEIGIAAGLSSRNNLDQAKYLTDNTSHHDEIDSYQAGAVDTGWQKKIVNYTVPSGTTVGDKNVLQLYVKGGSNQVQVYFDNIKVTKIADYTTNELFYSDYEDVDEDKLIPLTAYGAAWMQWGAGLGDTSVLKAETTGDHGKVLLYKQNATGRGQLILGYNYNTGDTSEFVRAEAGKTYRVTFDYKVQGAIGDNDLVFGLAAGDQFTYEGDGTINEQTNWENVADYDQQVSKRTVIKTLPANTEVDQTWQRITAEISFSAEQDFSKGNLLMIYAMNGVMQEDPIDNTRGLYFDNVRVEEVVSVSTSNKVLNDRVLCQEDYEKITDICEEHVGGSYGVFSNDLYPTELEGNKLLAYKHSWHGLGVAQLGFDYSSGNLGDNYINPMAGAAYRISFRYKIAADGAVSSDMTMGVAVGNTSIESADGWGYGEFKPYYDKEHTSAHEIFISTPATEVVSTDWIETTFMYTVPNGCDTTGKSLQLYIIGAGGATVYIDDVTVTELAGLYINSYPFGTRYLADGDLSYEAMAEDGYTMRWYTDASYKNAYFLSDYERKGTISEITLYGEKSYANLPIMKGDADLNGVVNVSDISALRGGLAGNRQLQADRMDVNHDHKNSVADIVRLKRMMQGTDMTENITIAGTPITTYKLINHIPTKAVQERVDEMKTLVSFSEIGEKTITISLEESLSDNCYQLQVDTDGNLSLKGQNIDAVAAATEMLHGYIKAGVSIDETDSMEFIYTGAPFQVSGSAVLTLSEGFGEEVEKSALETKKTLLTGKGFTYSYHTDDKGWALTEDNLSFKNGAMVLGVSDKSEASNNLYYGTEVRSASKYSYGYFEIRAKLNASNGICPAFWLLDTEAYDYADEWRSEIDIFENLGAYPNYVKGTLLNHHYTKDENSENVHDVLHDFVYESKAPEINFDPNPNYQNTYYPLDNLDEYHVFGLEWREDRVTWYVDGNAYLTATIPQTIVHSGDKQEYTCNWNQPMNIILTCYAGNNVANLAGTPDETTDFTNGSMQIDYVRVYQYK